jgi:hypothetical protein
MVQQQALRDFARATAAFFDPGTRPVACVRADEIWYTK